MMNIKQYINIGSERSVKVKKNIVYSFVNKLIAIIISLLLVSLTLGYIDASQYGIWLTLSSIVSWAAYFDLGFGHGFRNQFAAARARNNNLLAKKYVSTTYALLSIIFIFVFFVFALANTFLNWSDLLSVNIDNKQLSTVFLLLTGIFCIQSILNVFPVLLLADQKPAFSSMINTLGQFGSLIMIYGITKTMPVNLTFLSLALSGTPCLFLFIISIIMYRSKYKQFAPSVKNVDYSLVRNILGLGWRFFIIQLSMLLIFQVTNIILSRIQGAESVTLYTVAYKYFCVIYMVSIIILTPFWSAFTEAYTQNDFKWMRNVYDKLSRFWWIAVVGYIIMLFISPWIYKIWLHDSVEIPFFLSAIMGIYILVLSRAGLYMQLINGIGKVQIQMCVYLVFSTIAIPLMTWSCRMWGIVGVLGVAIFVYSFQCIFGHIQLKKILNNSATGFWDK